MAILKIYTYPAQILTQKAVPVTVFDKKMQSFFDNMIETMYTDDGVGLAAPQVGVSKKILIASPQNAARCSSLVVSGSIHSLVDYCLTKYTDHCRWTVFHS